MELKYRKLCKEDIDTVKEMIMQDKEISEDLCRAVDMEHENFTIVFLDEKIVGLAQIEPVKNTSFLVVFVSPKYRCKGIGQDILKYGENLLSEIQPKKIMTNYVSNNENSIHFARKHGYIRSFSSACMKYTDGKFNIDELPIRQYYDDEYYEAQKLYAEAFHEMRLSVGDFPNSEVQKPSENNRIEWNEDSNNRFTYIQNGEVAAHGHLHGNEIGSISVRKDLQGKGIGRNFVKYLCNEIYNRGYNEVILWCVIGNKARELYDSLGFKELYASEFSCKYFN